MTNKKSNIKEKVIEALKSGAGPTEAARRAGCSLTTARYHAKRLNKLVASKEKLNAHGGIIRAINLKNKLLEDKAHHEREIQRVNDLLRYIDEISKD